MDNVFRRYWTEAEERRLLAAMRATNGWAARRDEAWLQLLLATGCRIGEFARLTVADARAALREGWLFFPREHRKGGHMDHQVPVTKPVAQALRALAAIAGAEVAGDAPLVASRTGVALSVRSYQARIAHWCRMARVPHASPHWARHTRAMRIMKRSTAKDPRGLVQGALGHARIGSSGVYTRLSKEDLQRELELLDGARRVPKAKLRARYDERRPA